MNDPRPIRSAPLLLALSLCLTAWASGCAPAPQLPDGFVLLDEDHSGYTYRATTADGVVVAVRYLDHEPRGDLPFWTRAIENEMRDRGGYALLESHEVRTKSGAVGRRLRFGHDEASVPHEYWLSLFVTDKNIYVFEAGGPQKLLAEKAKALEDVLAKFEPR